MENSTTLIIGGSSSIGIALASRILKDGEQVLAHYHSRNHDLLELQKTYGEKIQMLSADLSNEGLVNELVAKILDKKLNIQKIIFCASSKAKQERLKKLNWSEFDEQISIQVKSTFLILKALMPVLTLNSWSRVVYISTSYTIGIPPAFIQPYVSAKYMLNGMMKAMSSEFASKGLTINGVAPSMIDSAFIDNLPDLVTESQKASHPLKKLAQAQDLVPIIMSLLDEKNGYMNGTLIPVTGGQSAF